MNSIPGDDPFLSVREDARLLYPERQRRARKFFRRSAAAAATVCAFVSGVKFWPIADDVARFSESSVGAAGSTDGWTGVTMLLFLIVCGMAAFAGYFAVRTLGWWVQMRYSQKHSRLRDAITAEVQESYRTSNWDYEEFVHEQDLTAAGSAGHPHGDAGSGSEHSQAGGLPGRGGDASDRHMHRRRPSSDVEAPPRRRRRVAQVREDGPAAGGVRSGGDKVAGEPSRRTGGTVTGPRGIEHSELAPATPEDEMSPARKTRRRRRRRGAGHASGTAMPGRAIRPRQATR